MSRTVSPRKRVNSMFDKFSRCNETGKMSDFGKIKPHRVHARTRPHTTNGCNGTHHIMQRPSTTSPRTHHEILSSLMRSVEYISPTKNFEPCKNRKSSKNRKLNNDVDEYIQECSKISRQRKISPDSNFVNHFSKIQKGTGTKRQEQGSLKHFTNDVIEGEKPKQKSQKSCFDSKKCKWEVKKLDFLGQGHIGRKKCEQTMNVCRHQTSKQSREPSSIQRPVYSDGSINLLSPRKNTLTSRKKPNGKCKGHKTGTINLLSDVKKIRRPVKQPSNIVLAEDSESQDWKTVPSLETFENIIPLLTMPKETKHATLALLEQRKCKETPLSTKIRSSSKNQNELIQEKSIKEHEIYVCPFNLLCNGINCDHK